VTAKYTEGSADTRTVRVREVADSIQYGHTASALVSEEGPRFLRITDIQNGAVDWGRVPSCNIAEKEIAKYRLSEGDLVFARTGATTGKSYLIRNCPEAVFASYLIRVRASKDIDPHYLAFFFQSPDYWRQIEQGKRGIGQPNVNGKTLGEVQLPLPPLDEQQQIVAEIEKQFTRLEAGVASLERVQIALKRSRASVLKAACEGRLVPTEAELGRKENRGYEPADILLESILKQRRGSNDSKKKQPVGIQAAEHLSLPEGWIWASFDQLTENFDGQRIPLKSKDRDRRSGPYPYYGASGIIDDIDDFLFDGEFLLIGEDGANLLARNTPIAFRASGRFWVNNHAHVVKTRGGIPLSYVEAYLNGKDLKFYVTGSAQPKLTQASMNKLPIPLPPFAEQPRIVAEVERRLSVINEIERLVAANLQRASKLRRSILQRGFSGEPA
jgi:type I restriction enzyme, S subunit